jgi:hypothetical protein
LNAEIIGISCDAFVFINQSIIIRPQKSLNNDSFTVRERKNRPDIFCFSDREKKMRYFNSKKKKIQSTFLSSTNVSRSEEDKK